MPNDPSIRNLPLPSCNCDGSGIIDSVSTCCAGAGHDKPSITTKGTQKDTKARPTIWYRHISEDSPGWMDRIFTVKSRPSQKHSRHVPGRLRTLPGRLLPATKDTPPELGRASIQSAAEEL